MKPIETLALSSHPTLYRVVLTGQVDWTVS